MGRPGLSAHRKFKRLARTIGCACMARGVLELIWDTCYEAGDDFLGDAQDVADACQWKGEPDALVKALWEAGGEGRAGFIEDCPDEPGKYICHDLWDHAPEYVEKRFRRELARREKGITMRDQRVAAGQASGRARRLKANNGEHIPLPVGTCVEQKGTDGEHMLNMCRTSGETPSPSPSPTPSHKEVPPLAPKGANGKTKKLPRSTQDIDPRAEPFLRRVYESWPKVTPTGEKAHKGPFAAAAKAFQKILDTEAISPKELQACGMLYAKADIFTPQEHQKVLEVWDYRDKAVMHVSSFYGPEKRPYRQFLPLAQAVISARSEATVQQEVANG